MQSFHFVVPLFCLLENFLENVFLELLTHLSLRNVNRGSINAMILNTACPLGDSEMQPGWRTPAIVTKALMSEDLSVRPNSQIY